jgi:predicted membrane protein DUF2079
LPWFTALAAVAWGLIATKVLIPHFNGGTPAHTDLFSAYGQTPYTVVKAMLAHPGRVLRDLTQPSNMQLLVQLLAPLAFLPLLAPGMLLPALGILLGNLTATLPAPHTINHQYEAAVLPFLFVATIVGVARLGDANRPGFPLLLATPLLIASVLGWATWAEIRLSYVTTHRGSSYVVLDRAVGMVHDGEGVAATEDITTHLTAHHDLFLFPDVFLHPNQAGEWERIDWVIVNRKAEGHVKEGELILERLVTSCGFITQRDEAGVLVLRRSGLSVGCRPA